MGNKRRKNNKIRLELGFQQAVLVDGIALVPCPICLSLYPLSLINEKQADGHVAMTIEDAPQRSHDAPAVQRCLTCRSCNNECAFEARAGKIKIDRRSLIEDIKEIGAPTEGTIEHSDALSLAQISEDEFLVELKTAYIIAYATLGPAFILDSSLDEVREAIRTKSLDPLGVVRRRTRHLRTRLVTSNISVDWLVALPGRPPRGGIPRCSEVGELDVLRHSQSSAERPQLTTSLVTGRKKTIALHG